MGNLYDKLGQHEQAAAVVTQVLDAREAADFGQDKNSADLRYNRACYRAALWAKEGNPQRKEVLKQAIMEDLRRSIEVSPANRESARVDPDFLPLRDDPEFQALTRTETTAA